MFIVILTINITIRSVFETGRFSIWYELNFEMFSYMKCALCFTLHMLYLVCVTAWTAS